MSRLAVKVQDLHCRYEDSRRWIFQGLSFSIHKGEVVLLLGPSGCGKSTLALCLKGLIPETIPAELMGRITINGHRVMQEDLYAQVGIVFQDPESQVVMPRVEEEVAFGLENLGLESQAIQGQVERALSTMGLSGLEHAWVDSLSMGQKQRLALASILAMEPSFLILDEPTANLDPRGSVDFFTALKRLKGTGITILLIEHRIDQSLELVDRVLVLDADGRLLRIGTPREVFGGDTASIEDAGIWLPTPCRLKGQLRRCGIHIHSNPLFIKDAVRIFGTLLRPKKLSPVKRRTLRAEQLPSTMSLESQALPGSRFTEVQTPLDLGSEAVRAQRIRFSYRGGRPVLEDLTFMVKRGEFHALVGANGSGKSTLAKILCGLLRPESGDVWLLGRPFRKVKSSEYAQYLGYVFQNPEHQFVTERVIDELSFSLRRVYSPEDTQRQVEGLLETFGLSEYAEQNPFTLSQGEKRRLSVATMIALEQPILILDEPTFGQDQAGALKLMELIHTLHLSGKTIILITHDMQLVLEYAQSVSVMGLRRILFRGHPQELFLHRELLEMTGLSPPFEVLLGQRLGDPLFFIRPGWVKHLASRAFKQTARQ
jgi:energy-coupling factor transporter ATP-binding protein EcfA2